MSATVNGLAAATAYGFIVQVRASLTPRWRWSSSLRLTHRSSAGWKQCPSPGASKRMGDGKQSVQVCHDCCDSTRSVNNSPRELPKADRWSNHAELGRTSRHRFVLSTEMVNHRISYIDYAMMVPAVGRRIKHRQLQHLREVDLPRVLFDRVGAELAEFVWYSKAAQCQHFVPILRSCPERRQRNATAGQRVRHGGRVRYPNDIRSVQAAPIRSRR